MASASAWLLCGLLAALSILHLYWAAGGRRGLDAAIPSVGGKPLFMPGKGACMVVALVLMIGAATPILPFEPWLKSVLLRVMAAVFALRACGDFRHVGFFKRNRDSLFAFWDTRLYSPLCLVLALLALFVRPRMGI
jgi:Protein of unknown function (DUF3995)